MSYGIIPALLCICTCCMYPAVGTAVGPEVPAVERIQLGHRYIGSALYINTGHQARSRERREARERRDTPSGGTSPGKPTVDSLSVLSYINSRFATTTVTSEMTNTGPDNQEAKFVVQIPETAFISNFSMLVGEEWVTAAVKEKGQAQTEYEEAKQQNKTTGLVAADTEREPERGMEYFKVSVNVGPSSSVRFVLEYQELISRRLGLFRHRISVRPQQLVQQLRVDVKIYEPQGIATINVIEPIQGNFTDIIASVNDVSAEVKSVTYSPSYAQQEKMNKTHGIDGDLIVEYDTYHPYDAGLVQFEDDYFVHFFSPSGPNMVPLGKNVVFVIDISGSMSGNKIEQTRESLQTILCQLRPRDQFLLILFDGSLYYWPENQQLRYATQENISKAKQYVHYKVKARGSTNIHSSLVKACQILSEKEGANIVVFLTDGQPTAGVTSVPAIISDVVEAAALNVSIFSLGFGFNLNYDLLAIISGKTGGFARRIYEDVDAALQLRNFFDEINTPLASNVELSYESNEVLFSSLTKYKFAQYFQGSEIVVAGKRNSGSGSSGNSLTAKASFYTSEVVELVKIIDTRGGMTVPPEATNTYQPGFLERLYIYLKIKDLLDAKLLTSDAAEKQELEDYALQLALDYNFVTPLTSLLVVEPEKPPSDWAGERGVAAPADAAGPQGQPGLAGPMGPMGQPGPAGPQGWPAPAPAPAPTATYPPATQGTMTMAMTTTTPFTTTTHYWHSTYPTTYPPTYMPGGAPAPGPAPEPWTTRNPPSTIPAEEFTCPVTPAPTTLPYTPPTPKPPTDTKAVDPGAGENTVGKPANVQNTSGAGTAAPSVLSLLTLLLLTIRHI